ncbi:MAG: tetratricopeptide repeat protein [Gemmatimonadetes bacterium]|nr:tetratricopeptide repeat protein [Gemmatimonadota bacterium]
MTENSSPRRGAGQTARRLDRARATAPVAGVAVLLAACATGAGAPPKAPTPADVARLEAALARDTSNVAARIALGAAYRASGEPEKARALLERAVAARPTDAGAVVALGLAYEDLGRFADARKLYTDFLSTGRPSAALRSRLRARLPLLARRELQAAVRAALADEQALGDSTPPEPRTVAVFPLLYAGRSPTLAPLGRALAELLVTDLSQTSRLRVLERARVQMLIDEMKLAENGLVDPQTAARTGRLLRAGRVVQGRIEGDSVQLRLEAAAVAVAGADSSRITPVGGQDAAERLFDLEKRIALGLYESMGIELTVAERERVMARPTMNLRALLEFGRGLEAEDRGDYAGAAEHYRRAREADPGFQMAAANGDEAEALALATHTQPTELVGIAGVSVAAGGPTAAGPIELLAPLDGMIADPSVRDVGPEVTRVEGLGQPATVRIIIRRP